jgi:hypothetical protein
MAIKNQPPKVSVDDPTKPERLETILGAITESTEAVNTHTDVVGADTKVAIEENADKVIQSVENNTEEVKAAITDDGAATRTLIESTADDSDVALEQRFQNLESLISNETSSVIENDNTNTESIISGIDTLDAGLIKTLNDNFTVLGSQLAELKDLIVTLTETVKECCGEEQPSSWQERDDLLPDEGDFVFGAFAGTGETYENIEALLGRPPGLATIYWKQNKSPYNACKELLDIGIIPRLELELVRIINPNPMFVDGKSFWKRVSEGVWDDIALSIFKEIDRLGRPIVVSWGHESDLRTEQGANPKSENPPPETFCGEWSEFADAWRHLWQLAADNGITNIRWFWNMSGGYTDAGKEGGRWDQMFPGVEYVDFIGWDGFDWFGVRDKTRTSFASMMTKFDRWDFYKRKVGERGSETWRPLMIGETACCESDGTVPPADKWMDDMRAWLHTHPDVTHVIWFSVKYTSHDRRLSGGPEKKKGTQNVSRDTQTV